MTFLSNLDLKPAYRLFDTVPPPPSMEAAPKTCEVILDATGKAPYGEQRSVLPCRVVGVRVEHGMVRRVDTEILLASSRTAHLEFAFDARACDPRGQPSVLVRCPRHEDLSPGGFRGRHSRPAGSSILS